MVPAGCLLEAHDGGIVLFGPQRFIGLIEDRRILS
jgi:cobalamin biosynthesis protein CobT